MTREENKKHLSQASSGWLRDKIIREKGSIKANIDINKLSQIDIDICEEILKEREQVD